MDDGLFEQRMLTIEQNPHYRVLRSANVRAKVEHKITQYIVYTDFIKYEGQQKTASIFVYTPWQNSNAHGKELTDYQTQLLFDYNGWDQSIHIVVLETLGAASKLAFYDYQNYGLATLAVSALIKLARRLNVKTITCAVSSFDGANQWDCVCHIFEKAGFVLQQTSSQVKNGQFTLQLG